MQWLGFDLTMPPFSSSGSAAALAAAAAAKAAAYALAAVEACGVHRYGCLHASLDVVGPVGLLWHQQCCVPDPALSLS